MLAFSSGVHSFSDTTNYITPSRHLDCVPSSESAHFLSPKLTTYDFTNCVWHTHFKKINLFKLAFGIS